MFDRLVTAIRCREAAADGPPAIRAQRPIGDWDAFLRSADRHRVTPLIARTVDAWGPDAPAATRVALATSARHAATEALAAVEALRSILAAFAEAGVIALAWKGPALALQAWEDLAARTFSDIDIVVDPVDRDRARTLLHALGWRSRWAMSAAQERTIFETQGAWEFTRESSPRLLELHWEFSARRFAGRLPARDVLRRAARVRSGVVELPVPSAGDLLVLLAQHATKHGWSTLEDVAVFAALVRRHQDVVEEACDRAREVGGARALLLGCALARSVLTVRLPDAIARAIERDAAVAPMMVEVRERWAGGDGAWRSTLGWDLTWTSRPRDRARLLARSLFDPTLQEWLAVELPDPLLPLYRVVRPLRLLARALR